MSIRIHELAKKIGMDNKSLLALLKERNFDVKTASSTIDNISAEALQEELAQPEVEETPAKPAVPVAPAPVPPPAPGTPPKVNLPCGACACAGRQSSDRATPSAEQLPRSGRSAANPACVASGPRARDPATHRCTTSSGSHQGSGENGGADRRAGSSSSCSRRWRHRDGASEAPDYRP